LFNKCEHGEDCGCKNVKKELSLRSMRSKSETRNNEENQEAERRSSEDVPPLSPLEIKIYTSKTLPKRIETIKQKKMLKQNSTFYASLNDDETSNELKIVESTDGDKDKEIDQTDDAENSSKKNDSDIIRSILEKSEIAPQRRLSKGGGIRRKSIEQMETNCSQSPLSSRKLSEALAAIQIDPTASTNQTQSSPSTSNQTSSEPLYEELLRNVHVPYKFAPSMVKRSLSTSSSSSTKETASLNRSKNPSSNTINDNDDSDCDYVTLTYNNDGGLETVDGEFVGKTDSMKKQDSSPVLSSMENSIMSSSSNELNRRDSFTTKSRSFLYKLVTMKSTNEDDVSSQRSIAASISSRKSFDGGNINLHSPPIYHQGSEALGNRIANVDYADPKTLFPSAVNIFINKTSMSQRDSLVTSSSDSVCDSQKLKQSHSEIEQFCDSSFYEETAESLLENDFRDSAIYSDDSNEKKMENQHIYATVNKLDKPTPPKIPKKPQIPLRVNRDPLKRLQSPPPPVPTKPSCLKSPEVRNAILSIRKHSKFIVESEMKQSSSSTKYWSSDKIQKLN
jgi:pleckstrin homology domain-containing family G member 1/2/3